MFSNASGAFSPSRSITGRTIIARTRSPTILSPKIIPNYCFCVFRRLIINPLKAALGWDAWREEWVRGGDDFWDDLEQTRIGQFGAHVETKSQYLHLIEDVLRTASHIGKWTVAHVEDGFISTQDVVETIGDVRRVDTIYTKDFTELTGTKAVIITA